jgi:hypothetical protein
VGAALVEMPVATVYVTVMAPDGDAGSWIELGL